MRTGCTCWAAWRPQSPVPPRSSWGRGSCGTARVSVDDPAGCLHLSMQHDGFGLRRRGADDNSGNLDQLGDVCCLRPCHWRYDEAGHANREIAKGDGVLLALDSDLDLAGLLGIAGAQYLRGRLVRRILKLSCVISQQHTAASQTILSISVGFSLNCAASSASKASRSATSMSSRYFCRL